jgi:hypothetical protein
MTAMGINQQPLLHRTSGDEVQIQRKKVITMSSLPAVPPDQPLLNPAALRIPTAARNSEQRKQRAASLKIAKPRPDDWVTIHPDEAFRWENFWSYEKDKKFYLLSPALYDQLEDNVQRVFVEHDFYLTGVLNADPIVWFVKHSDTEYFRTMRGAVEAAMTGWVQVQSNQHMKRYDLRHASAKYDTPDWSEFTTADHAQKLFAEIFAGQVITTLDHEVLERIGGRK